MQVTSMPIGVLAALCAAAVMQASGLSFDLEEAKKRPTTKVVELLKGMSEQLESEAKADEETYDKFSCWCKENTLGKTKAVEEGKAKVKVLKERIQVLVAKSQRLKAETERTEDEVAKNQAALETATALRKDQNKEFLDDRKQIEGDLEGVSSAETALSGSDAGNFLQMSLSHAVKPMLQQLMVRHFDKLSTEDRDTFEAFVQEGGDGVDGVLGVVIGLKDEFSANLQKLNEDETAEQKQFEELDAAKKSEIDAGIKQIETKKEEKAAADEERAHKKQELKDTEATIGADLEFAEEVKVQCADMDSQWDERQKTRAEESEAISKAIETLDADEAHDNFAKTFNPSFLQETAESGSRARRQQRRQQAAAALAAAGKLDARLVTLAMQAKIDKFTKVKKAMDDMAAGLKQQIQDEVEQKDFCVKSFNKNQLLTEDKTRKKNALQAKENAIDVKKPADEIQTMQDEVTEMKKQLQLASQNREEENKEFQKEIPEQRTTQTLLKQALDVLGKFYNKGALVQMHSQANPKAPGGFKDYKANGQSFGVMTMIQQLITDSEAAEAEATRAEKSAQKAYESFAKETSASVEKKEKAIADKTSEKAKLKAKLVTTRKAREAKEAELESLATTLAELHESCDFLMANFDARQTAMTEEIEAVNKAKAILSGATFAEIQLS